MNPDITITKIVACVVGLAVLCCIYELPYWWRRRKQRKAIRDMDCVFDEMRAEMPCGCCEIPEPSEWALTIETPSCSTMIPQAGRAKVTRVAEEMDDGKPLHEIEENLDEE